MSSYLISLLSTIGAWLGGFAAHLFPVVLAPALDSVRQHLFPTPPTPHPLAHPIADLAQEVNQLGLQVELLREILQEREEPIVYEMAIRAVPRRRH